MIKLGECTNTGVGKGSEFLFTGQARQSCAGCYQFRSSRQKCLFGRNYSLFCLLRCPPAGMATYTLRFATLGRILQSRGLRLAHRFKNWQTVEFWGGHVEMSEVGILNPRNSDPHLPLVFSKGMHIIVAVCTLEVSELATHAIGADSLLSEALARA